MRLVVTWADVRGFNRFHDQVRQIESQFPKAIPRLMNQVGRRAKTKVIRSLTKQTGLSREVIVRAVKEKAAFTGDLHYDLRTRGGNVRLKYLRPQETTEGVVAYPFSQRTLYPRTFMRGGEFPDRKVVPEFDGHVMFRNRSSGRHYTFARSGVYIPEQMVEGMALEAWQSEVRTTLPARLDALIAKLLG